MVGRWATRWWSSIALYGINVLCPGRDTLGLKSVVGTVATTMFDVLFPFILLFGWSYLCYQVIYFLGCNPLPNPLEITVEGIPFRFYRGRSRKRSRLCAPIYGLLHRRGNTACVRFVNGLADRKPPDKEPRRLRRERARANRKRKPPDWCKLPSAEQELNKLDEFERIKASN